MKQPLARWQRVLLGLSLPFAGVLLFLYEKRGGVGLQCRFHQLTGLYCPGCGSGRAVAAALHGNFAQSFAYNPLLYLLGIPAIFVLLHEYLRLVFPGLGFKAVYLPKAVVLGCTALIFAFWILRNIPAFSFLSPG